VGEPPEVAPVPWDHTYEGYIFEGPPLPYPDAAEPLVDVEGFQLVPFPVEPSSRPHEGSG
jgi:hypothetical protein